LTQEELAEQAGLSVRGISDLERGVKHRPHKDTVQLLADALQLSGEDRNAFAAAARVITHRVAGDSRAEPTQHLEGKMPLTALAPSTQVRAFLIADMRGYAHFTLEQGDEAAARLTSKFATLARELVAARGGEVIELRGDEVLASFSSARDALRAAVELQNRFAHEKDLPLPAGIGLDAGEAISVEGGYRGTALNLAARLCSLAGPGEVLASEGVIHLARKTEGLAYLERGLVELKGFVYPIKVIQVIAEIEAPEGQTAAPGTAPSLARPAESPLPVGGFLGSLPSGSIVARDDELASVLAAVDTVADGTGQLVLLGGRQGIGKTRLAQEATRVAHNRGFLIATGRCYETERNVAFFPFLEALAMAYAAAPPSLRIDIPRRWPYLALLLPEQAAAPTPDQPADQQEWQQPTIRAVTGFLSAIAHERPVALFFDDLHWADEASLRLLTHLARQTRGQRVLLLGTYRDSELRRGDPLDQALRELVRERLVDRVVVRRLTAEGTAAMVAAIVGEVETSEEFVEFVHRKSQGLPFFIDEILRSLGGHYRLVREIGAGGMGRVFQAVDTRDGKVVAAKIMFASKEAEVDAAVRFEQEGAVLATLQHPNIVQVYGTFMDEHASCIIMELLQGQSLMEVLTSEQLDLARIKRLMLQVAAALAAAHGRGIVHRDIKPDNIMVLGDDQVKVTDFGIARILRPTATLQTMGSTGMTLGTPHYMSPEQIDGRKVDGRADIYALGAVLYQLVTGRPPFEGDDPLTIAFKHVNEAPQMLRKARPGVPRDWEALVLKALAKHPADRFQSATALEAAIAELSTEDTRRVVGAEPAATEHAPTPRRARLRILTPPLRQALDRGEQGVGGEAVLPRPQEDGGTVAEATSAGLPGWWERAMGAALARPYLSATVVAAVVSLAVVWFVRASQSGSPPTKRTPVAIFQAQPSSSFQAPDGVTVDAQGNIYVADQLTNRIKKLFLDPTRGALVPLAEWGGPGSGPGQFSAPAAIAVDPQGNIYVSDTNNNRIQKLSPSGQPLKQWGHQGTAPGQFSNPFGIALDAKGNIYVADQGNHRIQKLSPSGQPMAQWSHNFQYLVGLAVDGHGNVYVADSKTDRLEKLSAGGRVLRGWSTNGGGQGASSGPSGVAVDGRGNVYVADQVSNTIQKFSSNGALLASFGSKTSRTGRLQSPQGVAVDRRGNIYVADTGNRRVELLSASGNPIAHWTGTGAGPDLFQAPSSVALDSHGNVYAADSTDNGLIYKLFPSGQPAPTWRTRGAASPPFTYGGVAVDAHGNVFVSDRLNNDILQLSPTGRRLAAWTRTPAGTAGFDAPAGMATDAKGDVYVADTGNDRIVKLFFDSRRGVLVPLKSWGSAGNGQLQFSSPTGVAVDASGNIYVVDSSTNTVQKLSSMGHFLNRWGSPGSGNGQLKSPSAIAIDRQGNVYVADTGNNRIQEFASDGSFVAKWGTKGSLPGQFQSPGSVAVDAQGHIYVGDTDNHRIQKFSRAGVAP
jgi:class 3 adenylate cyclase/sugar lactone lactonase YvrE